MIEEINAIKEKLQITEDINEKVDLKNKLSELIRPSNAEQSFELCAESIELAKSVSYQQGLARAYWNSGICCRLLSDYDKAFQFFENSLTVYELLNDLKGKARVLNSISNIYLNLSDYKYSLDYLKRSLKLLDESDDRPFTASVLSNIGLTYQELGDYPSSLEYYLRSMQMYLDSSMNVPMSLLNNIGLVYQCIGDYSTALNYYEESLKLADRKNNMVDKGFTLGNIAMISIQFQEYEKAIEYLEQSEKLLVQVGYRHALSNVYSKMAEAYKGLKDYEKALEYHLMALKISEEISDIGNRAALIGVIGEIYFAKGDYSNAENYYKECLNYAKSVNDEINEAYANKLLGILFSKKGDLAGSFEYLDRAHLLADKRKAFDEVNRINRIFYEIYKEKGDSEKALEYFEKYHNGEKEILNNEAEKKIKSLIVKNQIQQVDHEKKIALQEKEIYRLKNIELAESNDLLKRTNEEKNDFIGIIAHDLRNPLSGIISISGKMNKTAEKIAPPDIQRYTYEIVRASEKMLTMVNELLDINMLETGNRKLKSEKFDPAKLVKQVADDYKDKGTEKNISIRLNPGLGGEVNLDKGAVNQILDNLVSNAIKFSPADKEITLSVKTIGGMVRFEVQDEGPGLKEKDKTKLFSKFAKMSAVPTGNESTTGLGLYIVKTLATAMNGTIWCESEFGSGAQFIVELPSNI